MFNIHSIVNMELPFDCVNVNACNVQQYMKDDCEFLCCSQQNLSVVTIVCEQFDFDSYH